MDDRAKNIDLIKAGGVNLLVGNVWESNTKQKGLMLKIFLRGRAQATGLHFSAQYRVESGHLGTQFCLASIEEAEGTVVAGEIVVAQNIHKWLPDESRQTAIFIRSIPNNDPLKEPRYWLTAINEDGSIAQGSKGLVSDRFLLEETLSLFSITNEKFTLVASETDGAARTFIDDAGRKLGVGQSVSVVNITESMFNDAVKESAEKASFQRIYRPSKIKAKRVGIVASLVAAAAMLGLAYSYVAQLDERSYFDDESMLQSATEQRSRFQKKAAELKISSSQWDEESFRYVTLDEFTEALSGNLFRPIEIAAVMNEMNRTLPVFSAEWRLTKMTYQSNRFFARYERIDGGKGVYFLLDQNMNRLNTLTKKLSVKPFVLQDEGRTRIYEITPSIRLPHQGALSEMKNKLREESRINSLLSRALKAGVDKANDLLDAHDDYNQLSFKARWLALQGGGILEQAKRYEKEMMDASRDIKILLKEQEAFERLSLENDFIIGNVMDFVSIMQMDSLFDWSYPVLVATYPAKKVLEERNKNATKKKKGKKGASQKNEIYAHAIERYKVEITTLASSDEEKIKSYGMGDLSRLAMLINKPFVNVDVVEYDSITEQWKFSVHFHRQTSEYRNRIIPMNKKEVKQ